MDCLRNLMLCAILFMFVVDKSLGQGMNTGGTKDYKLVPFDISDTTSLVFEVKACDNIHILLMEDPNNDTNSVYEIAIGGEGNTKSVIRKQIIGTDYAENTSPRADCTVSKPFWIKWTSGTITVGEGYLVGIGSFMSYTDPTFSPVNRFRVSTGYGTSGEWNFGSSCSVRGDPHEKTLDGVKFTYSGACFYDILYIDSDFFIRGHYQKCRNDKSCVDEVYILYKSHLISFLKEDIVKHDSANVNNFPYTTSDGLIKIREATGVYKYEVVLPNSVNVKWDGERKILIDVGMSFYGATQGLCGLYNQDSADDLTLRNGTAVSIGDKDKFGNDWAIVPESTNIALNKLVSQSSYWPDPSSTGNGAHKAIDGCNKTSWGDGCCTHTHQNLNAWWQIDLGYIHAISRIVITLRTDCTGCEERMKGFQVFVSETELVNTTISTPVYTSPSSVTKPGPVVTIEPNVSGRFVKVVIPDRSEYLTLCEVEIYEDGCEFV